jgi:hypothetical protein
MKATANNSSKLVKLLTDNLNSQFINDMSFVNDFNAIISDHATNYDGKAKEQLKSFFNDLQHGGCISGMIGEFIYHNDCKAFYIKHIDDLEEFKTDLENNIGEAIKNRYELPHYTFVVWLCFEEFCNNIYNNMFE